ncbi:hypothetical protein BG000_001484 [Podila horticola]|nr:hypothetical protein BG000_001484 [Podila horticola]
MVASNVSNQQNIPRLFLGNAGAFGLEHTDRFQSFVLLHGAKAVQLLVDLFKSHGYVEVDTARIHADSEAVLGLLEKSTLAGLKFSTKAHPLIMPFSKENVLKQFYESLTVLGVEHADETVAICKAKGYIAPTVYQVLYSPIARSDYLAHHDVLKKHGICYYAYGVMASGLLTGKHKFDKEANADTRLHSSAWFSDHLKHRYWHREVFAVLDLLTKAADKEDIRLAQATNRWMRHRSG